jgi:hypothetical protein
MEAMPRRLRRKRRVDGTTAREVAKLAEFMLPQKNGSTAIPLDEATVAFRE